MSEREPMTLDDAIRILLAVHTLGADAPLDYTVSMGACPENAAPWISNADYVEAWGVLFRHART